MIARQKGGILESKTFKKGGRYEEDISNICFLDFISSLILYDGLGAGGAQTRQVPENGLSSKA